jgi:hypothetical protein
MTAVRSFLTAASSAASAGAIASAALASSIGTGRFMAILISG